MSLQKRKRARRLVILGLVVIAIIVIVRLVTRSSHAALVETTRVVRKDLQQVVTASGKMRPWTEVDIGSRVNGTVLRVAVQEGDQVKKGNLLLEIDPIPVETQKQQLEAALSGAKERFASTKLLLDQARRNLERTRSLFQQGLATEDQLERAQTDYEVREREFQIAQYRIQELQAQLASIEHQYEQVQITAPMDGWVIGLYVEEGETVVVNIAGLGSDRPLVRLADLTRWKVQLEVDEADVVHIRPGMRARITLDALPEQEFWGRVTLVGYQPLAESRQQLGTAVRENLFPVEVELNQALPSVRPGFTAHADIITAEAKNVLAIPIQALVYRKPEASSNRDEEEPGVFVVENGVARFRPVELGIMGEFDMEVKSGVREGEEIINGPFQVLKDLKDGDPIRVRKE